MQKTPRKKRHFSAAFKTQLMREIEAGKARSQVSREHAINESQLSRWYAEYRQSGEEAFSRKTKKSGESAKIEELERAIGRLHMENDILKRASSLLETKLRQLRQRED